MPVERVRLDKTTVTEQEQVTEGLRKEEIEVEGADDRPRPATGPAPQRPCSSAGPTTGGGRPRTDSVGRRSVCRGSRLLPGRPSARATISGTSSAEASSRQECIASIGLADVDRRDAEPGRGQRADRAAAGQVGAADEALHRHAGLGAPLGEPAAAWPRRSRRPGSRSASAPARRRAAAGARARAGPRRSGAPRAPCPPRPAASGRSRGATACGSAGSVAAASRLDDVLEEAAPRRRTSSRCRPPRGRCRPAAGSAAPAVGGQQRQQRRRGSSPGCPAGARRPSCRPRRPRAAGWVSVSTRS